MAVSALAVANYFVEKSNKSEGNSVEKITQMKLQKMIYIAHGLSLAEHNQPLINEDIIAWRFGPVVRSVYDAFKANRNNIITEFAKDEQEAPYKLPNNLSASTMEILDEVWDSCLEITGIQLSNWSHEKDSPWDRTYKKDFNKIGNLPIPDHEIQKYFKTLI